MGAEENFKHQDDYVEIRLQISRSKRDSLMAIAKEEGQNLPNFLRPFLYRIADGDLALVVNSKK